MTEITVTIQKGKAVIETRGFVGTACKDATKDLERAMGTVTSDTPTPEMHNREVRQISN